MIRYTHAFSFPGSSLNDFLINSINSFLLFNFFFQTDKIDKLCYDYLNDNGAYSAPLFYRGFPKSCCTSVNHVVCHGIPSDKILKEGDIVNVDVTAFKEGWHGDTSRTFEIGEVSIKAKKLVQTTYNAMMKSIKIIKEGATMPSEADVNAKIQEIKDADTAKANAKTSGKAKLKAGEALTDAEIEALFGA